MSARSCRGAMIMRVAMRACVCQSYAVRGVRRVYRGVPIAYLEMRSMVGAWPCDGGGARSRGRAAPLEVTWVLAQCDAQWREQ